MTRLKEIVTKAKNVFEIWAEKTMGEQNQFFDWSNTWNHTNVIKNVLIKSNFKLNNGGIY